MEELLTFTDAGIFNSAAFLVFICTDVSPVASSTLVQGVCLRHHPLFGGLLRRSSATCLPKGPGLLHRSESSWAASRRQSELQECRHGNITPQMIVGQDHEYGTSHRLLD